jgi:hypothetical protein
MAFKLTYSDGQATDYDDSTKWEVENGVVKMGREAGEWTVFVSPSHWATLEKVSGKDKAEGQHDKDDDHDDGAKSKGKHKKDNGKHDADNDDG